MERAIPGPTRSWASRAVTALIGGGAPFNEGQRRFLWRMALTRQTLTGSQTRLGEAASGHAAVWVDCDV